VEEKGKMERIGKMDRKDGEDWKRIGKEEE
jgi:hypothetical protein